MEFLTLIALLCTADSPQSSVNLAVKTRCMANYIVCVDSKDSKAATSVALKACIVEESKK